MSDYKLAVRFVQNRDLDASYANYCCLPAASPLQLLCTNFTPCEQLSMSSSLVWGSGFYPANFVQLTRRQMKDPADVAMNRYKFPLFACARQGCIATISTNQPH